MACEYEHYVHELCVCMWTINGIRIMIVEGEHKKVGLVPTKWEHRKKEMRVLVCKSISNKGNKVRNKRNNNLDLRGYRLGCTTLEMKKWRSVNTSLLISFLKEEWWMRRGRRRSERKERRERKCGMENGEGEGEERGVKEGAVRLLGGECGLSISFDWSIYSFFCPLLPFPPPLFLYLFLD